MVLLHTVPFSISDVSTFLHSIRDFWTVAGRDHTEYLLNARSFMIPKKNSLVSLITWTWRPQSIGLAGSPSVVQHLCCSSTFSVVPGLCGRAAILLRDCTAEVRSLHFHEPSRVCTKARTGSNVRRDWLKFWGFRSLRVVWGWVVPRKGSTTSPVQVAREERDESLTRDRSCRSSRAVVPCERRHTLV